MLHEVCGRLLPPQAALHLDTIAMEDHGLTLDVAVTTPQATCPDCPQPSTHIHSDYRRTLTDLPWATTPVTLHLRVRRFWCATPSCGRQTFAERVPQIAPHYARATARLTALQTSTGLALGGTAGARHLARQGAAGSRNTLLRRVRRLPPPAASRPWAIGIDDWAKRTGHTYGTIVVDLDRRCPVDLLEDRTAETVAAWLRAHPEVTVVARDRAEAYASGVTQGAPDAVQVADRWHLVKNLREAVEAELRERPTLPWCPSPAPAEALPTGTPPHASPADSAPLYPATPTGRRAEAARQARRTQRLGQYEQACSLRQQGLSMARIARQVGVSPRTLCRWFAAEVFPECKRRTGETSCLDPYTPMLQQQWDAWLSPCDPSVAHAAGAGLSGLLRRGLPICDRLTLRAASTVLGLCASSSVAGGDTPAEPDSPAALVSLRASSRAAHPRRAGARGADTAARCNDCPDCDADRNLSPDGAPADSQ